MRRWARGYSPQRQSVSVRRCRRHRFADWIERAIHDCYELDNWHGPVALAADWLLIALFIAGPYLVAPLFAPTHSDVAWWLIYATISVPCIGVRMRALATLLHESAHHILARHPTLNFVLGTFGSGYLIFQGWHTYHRTHVQNHHGRFGDEDHDPDYQFQLTQGNYAPQSRRTFIRKNLVAPLLFLKTPAKIVDLFRNRFFSQDEPLHERLVKGGYVVALSAFLLGVGLGRELVLFWVAPYVLVFPIVNWYIELFEHYPLMQADLDLEMSRNRWTGGLGKFFQGMHHENLHLVHHLRPRVPFWHLPRVHLLMMHDAAYRAAQHEEQGILCPMLPGTRTIVQTMVQGGQAPGLSPAAA